MNIIHYVYRNRVFHNFSKKLMNERQWPECVRQQCMNWWSAFIEKDMETNCRQTKGCTVAIPYYIINISKWLCPFVCLFFVVLFFHFIIFLFVFFTVMTIWIVVVYKIVFVICLLKMNWNKLFIISIQLCKFAAWIFFY
jgi:hypothetical protein